MLLTVLCSLTKADCALYVQVPQDISTAEDKRAGVEVVEVVFALPITADGHARPDPHAQVFAFLPVKAYGFR